MIDNREERIKQRAHELWEREGSPHGRDQDHWRKAAAQIDEEDAIDNEVAPGTAAAGGLAGRSEGTPSSAEGLDDTDAKPRKAGRSKKAAAEEIADTSPAQSERRRKSVAADPDKKPRKPARRKAADADPGKMGATPGGNTVPADDKKPVRKRAVRGQGAKSASKHSEGPADESR